MASLVPVPEYVLSELRRKHDRQRYELHVAIYDSCLQVYRVMSDIEWRKFQRCDGFNFERYSLVASTILEYSRP